MNNGLEIRWHGRGGQGAKTAALLLADVAFKTGKYVQGFPEYGPERMGAPITAYNRISDEVIRRLGNRDKEQKNGHIGFYNVDTIIRLHYGKDYGLRAERLAAGGTKVTIRIPVKGSGQPAPGMENRS